MKNSVTFTTNGVPAKICDIHAPRGRSYYVATIIVKGTFGSGTANIFITDDMGVTLIPLAAQAGGSAITFTANGMQLVNFGFPSDNFSSLQIWASVTGGTSPNVTVSIYDNR